MMSRMARVHSRIAPWLVVMLYRLHTRMTPAFYGILGNAE